MISSSDQPSSQPTKGQSKPPSSNPTMTFSDQPSFQPSKPCPSEQCIDRCYRKYGPTDDAKPWTTLPYYCAKGCVVVVSSGKVVRANVYCFYEESERYSTCYDNCEKDSSRESHIAECRYGCQFWESSDQPSSQPTKPPGN